MKKRNIKKIISLVVLICILGLSIGFLSVLSSNDFDIKKMFSKIITPFDHVVPEVPVIPNFGVNGEDITDQVVIFENDNVYDFSVPFEEFSAVMTYSGETQLIILIDDYQYDLRDSRDITEYLDSSFGIYSYSINFTSLEEILQEMYLDLDISIPNFVRDNYYDFQLVFYDEATNQTLTVDISISVGLVDRVVLNKSILLF